MSNKKQLSPSSLEAVASSKSAAKSYSNRNSNTIQHQSKETTTGSNMSHMLNALREHRRRRDACCDSTAVTAGAVDSFSGSKNAAATADAVSAGHVGKAGGTADDFTNSSSTLNSFQQHATHVSNSASGRFKEINVHSVTATLDFRYKYDPEIKKVVVTRSGLTKVNMGDFFVSIDDNDIDSGLDPDTIYDFIKHRTKRNINIRFLRSMPDDTTTTTEKQVSSSSSRVAETTTNLPPAKRQRTNTGGNDNNGVGVGVGVGGRGTSSSSFSSSQDHTTDTTQETDDGTNFPEYNDDGGANNDSDMLVHNNENQNQDVDDDDGMKFAGGGDNNDNDMLNEENENNKENQNQNDDSGMNFPDGGGDNKDIDNDMLNQDNVNSNENQNQVPIVPPDGAAQVQAHDQNQNQFPIVLNNDVVSPNNIGRNRAPKMNAVQRQALKAMKNNGKAGAKSVQKCIRHYLEYVLTKEGTGDLCIPNNDQSKHRTRSNGSCTILYSSIDTTLREELWDGTDDEGWTRQGTWLELVKKWGFETDHIPFRGELGSSKPAILGQNVPTFITVKLAKTYINGTKVKHGELDYNMTHMVLLLPSNGNGTKNTLIDPDGDNHVEFGTSPFANWSKKTKKTGQSKTNKTLAKKIFEDCLGADFSSKIYGAFTMKRREF
jgi:hypothetical protein